MQKRFRLFCCLTFVLFLASSLSALKNRDYEYDVSDGTVVVVKYLAGSSVVEIPETIDGYPVTEIGPYAFFQGYMETVIVPASVELIGEGAFADSYRLKEFEVDPENQAFRSIDGILYDQGIEVLVAVPPRLPGLSDYQLPDTIREIAAFAFNRSYISELILPDTLIRIGKGAFLECTDLVSFTASETNPYLSTVDGVLYDKLQETLIAFPPLKLEEQHFEVPSSVTELGDFSFTGARILSVDLPLTLEVIGEQTFSHSWITSLVIPDSVQSIGYRPCLIVMDWNPYMYRRKIPSTAVSTEFCLMTISRN